MEKNLNTEQTEKIVSEVLQADSLQPTPDQKFSKKNINKYLIIAVVLLTTLAVGVYIIINRFQDSGDQPEHTLSTNTAFIHPKKLYTFNIPSGWSVVERNMNSYKSAKESTEDFIILSPDYQQGQTDLIPMKGAYFLVMAERACSNDIKRNFNTNIPIAQGDNTSIEDEFQLGGRPAIKYQVPFNSSTTSTETIVVSGGYLYSFLLRYSDNYEIHNSVYNSFLDSVKFVNESEDLSIHPYTWKNMAETEKSYYYMPPEEWSLYRAENNMISFRYPSEYFYHKSDNGSEIYFYKDKEIYNEALVQRNDCVNLLNKEEFMGVGPDCESELGNNASFEIDISINNWFYNKYSNNVKNDLDRHIVRSGYSGCTEDYVPVVFGLNNYPARLLHLVEPEESYDVFIDVGDKYYRLQARSVTNDVPIKNIISTFEVAEE